MADERTNTAGEELLMDIRVAEASKLYKFYLNQERNILALPNGRYSKAW